MEIREIKDKNAWENFFLREEQKTFLQGWNWGEVQQRMGNKIWRLGIYDDEPVFMVLVTKIQARRGTFLLIQHLIQNAKFKNQNDNSKFKILEILLAELKRIGKKENADFIRVAPLWERSDENMKIFKDLGFRTAPMHASAYEATLKLDIASSEQALLANMRKTTRYLIKKTGKQRDIEIVKSANIEDIELYNKLAKATAARKLFVPFSPQLVRSEFEVFLKEGQALLFFGRYKEEEIATALVIFWSGMGFYHQAAMDPKHHKVPAAYLLQWEAIKEAKARGCKVYDFWGYVDPKKQPRHPWAGPSLFKMGFGGRVYEYVKTQDLPLSQKYWLTYIFEKLRKAKRGL